MDLETRPPLLPYKIRSRCTSAAGARHEPLTMTTKKGEEGGIWWDPANRVPLQPHLPSPPS
jgi:hypothetical protein